jgi:hypothetical protein
MMNILFDRWLNNDLVNRTYIPCQICGEPTNFLGTKLCNGCWEITSRLRSFLDNKNARDFVKNELTEATFRRTVGNSSKP